jgi:hypothetical protein
MTPDELAARQEKFGLNNMTVGGGVGLEWAEAFKNVPGGCRWPDEIGPEFLGWHGEM